MENKREHILADVNVGKLLRKLSVPATIGMFVMSTYNVVDTIFVGHGVGTLGIAGVAIVFPFQIFVLAISLLLGIGGASIISRALGAEDYNKAYHTLGNLILMAVILSLVITIAGELFINKILGVFGCTVEIFPYAHQYLQVILLGTIFRCLVIVANSIMRSEGRARNSMIMLVMSAVINIILDPIFIFVLNMGVRGAAIATVIAQVCAFVYAAYFFYSDRSSLELKLFHLYPQHKLVGETMAVGASAFSQNIAAVILVIIMNNALVRNGGELAIALFGIINRLTFMFFTPVIGISQGFQPIAGFNFGAKKLNKVRETVKIAILWSTLISAVGFIIMMFFPGLLLSAFSRDPQLLEMGTPLLRIVIALMPIIGFQVIGSTMFQAFGHAVKAFILTLSRQVLILIPLLLILPSFWGVTGVAVAFPVSDLCSAVITSIFVIPTLRKLKSNQI
ncbi:MATE family efflux transporter [bacterium]|nr:MATE family efflux transporter [bacterium]